MEEDGAPPKKLKPGKGTGVPFPASSGISLHGGYTSGYTSGHTSGYTSGFTSGFNVRPISGKASSTAGKKARVGYVGDGSIAFPFLSKKRNLANSDEEDIVIPEDGDEDERSIITAGVSQPHRARVSISRFFNETFDVDGDYDITFEDRSFPIAAGSARARAKTRTTDAPAPPAPQTADERRAAMLSAWEAAESKIDDAYAVALEKVNAEADKAAKVVERKRERGLKAAEEERDKKKLKLIGKLAV